MYQNLTFQFIRSLRNYKNSFKNEYRSSSSKLTEKAKLTNDQDKSFWTKKTTIVTITRSLVGCNVKLSHRIVLTLYIFLYTFITKFNFSSNYNFLSK